jgi:hypothetical protein
MAIVLTSCTNRKRIRAPRALTASAIRPAPLDDVVKEWGSRLDVAMLAGPASDLYCGRAFRQAEAAAHHLRAPLLVVSAGLGLVPAAKRVPSYSLTVIPGTADNILARISGRATPSEWWTALKSSSGFGVSLAQSAQSSPGPILVALSGAYLAMIAADLLAMASSARGRLRLFSLSSASTVPAGLRNYLMPYDARFDGAGSPMPGTRGDFAQRALAHFAETILPDDLKGSLESHIGAIEKALSSLRPPKHILRAKASDDEIIGLIHCHWAKVDGKSGRMLRYLRDDLKIACEQSRFRDLFIAAKKARS